MPLPMIHLAAARIVAERFPEYRAPAFWLGCLAPDAIHMRPGASRPEKWASHLRTCPLPPDYSREFYGDFRARFPSFPEDPYYAGYFVHLLTDLLWHEEEMFWRNYPAADQTLPEHKAVYYNDADQADKFLCDALPWREGVFEALAAAEEPGATDPVTGREAILWRERTFRWFDSYDPGRYVPAKYLTAQEALDFAERCGRKIAEFLSKAQSD